MIGFDFPIRPEWVHDTHQLCQPGMLVDELIPEVIQATMRELGGEKTRRNTLGNIIRYLVRTEGALSSRTRKLADVDALVKASKQWPISSVQPLYLARILLLNDVAYAAATFCAQRYEIGDLLTRGDIKRQIVSEFGERKVVLNAVSSFVRTLDYFGLFVSEEGRGTYRFNGRLHLETDLFPLLVLAWFERHQTPQINLFSFRDDPVFHFLNRDGFESGWLRFNGRYWSLERRLDGERATLKYPVLEQFEREIIK